MMKNPEFHENPEQMSEHLLRIAESLDIKKTLADGLISQKEAEEFQKKVTQMPPSEVKYIVSTLQYLQAGSPEKI